MSCIDPGVDHVDAHALAARDVAVAVIERIDGRIDAVQAPRRDRRLHGRRDRLGGLQRAHRCIGDDVDGGRLGQLRGRARRDGEGGAVAPDRQHDRRGTEDAGELAGDELGPRGVDGEDDVLLAALDGHR